MTVTVKAMVFDTTFNNISAISFSCFIVIKKSINLHVAEDLPHTLKITLYHQHNIIKHIVSEKWAMHFLFHLLYFSIHLHL
jgi:hypothetical protein